MATKKAKRKSVTPKKTKSRKRRPVSAVSQHVPMRDFNMSKMTDKAAASRTQKPPKYTPERAKAFCIVLADTCNIGKSAKSIGVTRKTVYDWREKYPDFAEAWDLAKKIGVSGLEDEAVRRGGSEGVIEPVYYRGEMVGGVRKHSDTLLTFLLSAHKPEKYGRQRLEHSGPDGVPLPPSEVRVRFVQSDDKEK